MNRLLQLGVLGTGQAMRGAAIVGVDLARQLEQVARSALTGVVVIAAGHLLGNSVYRELGDTVTTSHLAAARPLHAA